VEPGAPTSTSANTTLRARIATATLLIPLVAGALMFGSTALVAVLFGMFLCGAAIEWARLLGWTGSMRAVFVAAIAVSAAAASSLPLNAPAGMLLLRLGLVWWMFALFSVIVAQRGRGSLPNSAPMLAIAGWLTLVPAYQALVWLHEFACAAPLGLLMLVWVADSSAYFAGRRWGKRKLASRVSPGKTWAGVAAAVALAPLAGAGLVLLPGFHGRAHAGAFAALGLVTVCASIVGDLFESLMKRRAGMKDSGQLLPGHGGILDRIDSLLAAAPVFAVAALSLVSES
jgi:phosphatidate cytidylyltransferase